MSKTILLTGASSGFGKLAVPLLLERGHTVIAGIRGGSSRLESIFFAERKKFGDKLLAIDLHLDKQETFAGAKELIDNRFGGKLDVLINNAGFGLFGPLEDLTDQQLRHQFEVNFFGPVLLSRLLLPALRAARGRVLNVSSIVGLVAFPYYGSYAASKFALEAMTESLFYELKPFGVQAGLIEPGAFKTDFTTRSKMLPEGRAHSSPASYAARVSALDRFMTQTSGRQGNPRQVAKLIVKLVEKKRVPLRNIVGADARSLYFVKRLIPDSWRVFLEEFVFRKVVFRD